MSRFEFELDKRIKEEIAHLESVVVSGNLDYADYRQNTAKIAAYKRVLQEFFQEAITAMNEG